MMSESQERRAHDDDAQEGLLVEGRHTSTSKRNGEMAHKPTPAEVKPNGVAFILKDLV
jgi:hypothetical protein